MQHSTSKIQHLLWGQMDSNHRKHTLTDLQSVPFGHSGMPPNIINVLKRTPFFERECKDKGNFFFVKP